MTEQSAPALKKLDLTIARLRLLLADVTARENAIEGQRATFRDQYDKLVTFALYGDTTLDSVLTMMGDVEERIQHVEGAGRALHALRLRAERELESLQLTKGIEEAKSLLAQLKVQQQAATEPGSPLTRDEIQAEITRLQSLIAEASERAAKSLEFASRQPGHR